MSMVLAGSCWTKDEAHQTETRMIPISSLRPVMARAKHRFFVSFLFVSISVAAIAAGPTYWWVTLYDGGKPVQVWVAQTEPKVSGDTCRFVPQGQKNETVIHGVFSVSTQAPPNLPDNPSDPNGF
jgi:hypothetical protein